MTTTDLKITGMTCGHCVASVQEELGEIAGVSAVDVDLNSGGVSTATVTSEAPSTPPPRAPPSRRPATRWWGPDP